jgi:hypothetical protein
MGMMLKLSANPRALLRGAYERVEKEFAVETVAVGEAAATKKEHHLRRPTLYAPVRVGDRVHWALIDSGAELTLISTAFANFAGLVEESLANVLPSALQVVGVNGVKSPT